MTTKQSAIGLPRLREVLGGEEAVERLLKEPSSIEGKGVVLALDEDISAMFNSLEICHMVIGQIRQGLNPDELAELVSTCTGVEMSSDDLMKIGERIYNVEKAFNIREGMSRKDDTLPQSFFVKKETPWGPTGISEVKFQEMLDEYYKFRGWDKEGIPTKKKLNELNLDYIAEQIGAV